MLKGILRGEYDNISNMSPTDKQSMVHPIFNQGDNKLQEYAAVAIASPRRENPLEQADIVELRAMEHSIAQKEKEKRQKE